MYRTFLMMIIISSLFILGCAVAGKVVTDRLYHDYTYSIDVNFPDNYEIIPMARNSTRRVHASARLMVDGNTKVVAPQYVISVYPTEKTMEEFITSKQNQHFDPNYYWKFALDITKDVELNSHSARAMYFTCESQCITGVPSKNRGIDIFIQLDSHYMVVEYIAFCGWFNEAEFWDVVKSIDFNKFYALSEVD